MRIQGRLRSKRRQWSVAARRRPPKRRRRKKKKKMLLKKRTSPILRTIKSPVLKAGDVGLRIVLRMIIRMMGVAQGEVVVGRQMTTAARGDGATPTTIVIVMAQGDGELDGAAMAKMVKKGTRGTGEGGDAVEIAMRMKMITVEDHAVVAIRGIAMTLMMTEIIAGANHQIGKDEAMTIMTMTMMIEDRVAAGEGIDDEMKTTTIDRDEDEARRVGKDDQMTTMTKRKTTTKKMTEIRDVTNETVKRIARKNGRRRKGDERIAVIETAVAIKRQSPSAKSYARKKRIHHRLMKTVDNERR